MEVATKGVFEMIYWAKIGVVAVVFGAVAGMGGGIGRNLQGAEENKLAEKSDAATEKPSATETLRYAASYTMLAAPNEPKGRVPNFGKHQSWAYSSKEKAVYIFGGDGSDHQGVGNGSADWHYGRVHLQVTPPVFDDFYPYYGIAGKPCPAGYDCVPFTYDSQRDCFWQIGGYSWMGSGAKWAASQPWVGTPEGGGVWKFQAGEWTHVSKVKVPLTDGEGMAAMYYPRLDMVLGLWPSRVWFYRCANDERGAVGFSVADDREVERFCAPGYDSVKDEMLFVTPVNGQVIALSLANFPKSAPTRVIAKVPTLSAGRNCGQFPSLFVPKRRQLVLFYCSEASKPQIVIVNVDTGTVSDGPAPPADISSYINSAIYAPELDKIFGSVKDSEGNIRVLDWSK
jgi:hypothetical protein